MTAWSRRGFIRNQVAILAVACAVGAACVPLPRELEGTEFRCTSDTDCAAGQRCGTSGTCMSDALPVTPPVVTADAGAGDASMPRDAAIPDAAMHPDAARPPDAGRPDAGRRDASVPDAARPDGGIDNSPPDILPLDDVVLDEDGMPPAPITVSVRDVDLDAVAVDVFTTDERVSAQLAPGEEPNLYVLTLSVAPEFHGAVQVTVRADDRFSFADRRFLVTVRPVNDPPAFVVPTGLLRITEDEGEVVLPFVISGITPGAGEKATQHVVFNAEVVAANGEPFAVPPVVDPDGTLRLRTALNFFGAVTLRVTGTDDGAPPLVATGDVELLVEPVNDWPTVVLSAPAPAGSPNSAKSTFGTAATLTITDPDDGEAGRDLEISTEAVDPSTGSCSALPSTVPRAPADVAIRFQPAAGRVGRFACNVVVRDRPAVGGVLVPPQARTVVEFDVLPPARSCREILLDARLAALGVGTADGFHLVDLDGPEGPLPPGEVHCRMAANTPGGGGWTLAMRVHDRSTPGEFDGAFWTDPQVLLSQDPVPGPGVTEKYAPFHALPFSEALVEFGQGAAPVVVTGGGTSLRDVFASGTTLLAPRPERVLSTWVTSMPPPQAATVPSGCNEVGFNVGGRAGGRLRVGAIAGDDKEDGRCRPRAFIGAGADQELCGGPTVGAAVCSTMGGATLAAPSSVLVYVRESALATTTIRPSCMAHRLAGATVTGLYPIRPVPPGTLPGAPVPPGLLAGCDMERHGGGWTLLFNRGDENVLTGADMIASTPRGGPSVQDDHASRAADLLGVDDFMFTGAGGQAAVYQGAGQGLAWSQLASLHTVPTCDHAEPIGYAMTAGAFTSAQLCSRTLYLSPLGRSVSGTPCDPAGVAALGPAFSTAATPDLCPLSNPGLSSLGLNASVGAVPALPLPAQMWGREVDFTAFAPEATCQAHRDRGRTISGTYRLLSRIAHCRMEGTEGWMRVVRVDRGHMDGCPGDMAVVPGPRACGRASVGMDNRVRGATWGVEVPYRHVRGHIRALQMGTPDAFWASSVGMGSLEGPYVDGVSITRGAAGARRHVFTYAVANHDTPTTGLCPGRPNGYASPPGVDAAFFCDSGQVSVSNVTLTRVYAENPLFDGLRGAQGAPASDPAEFVRDLGEVTTDPLEVRLMADQDSADEDVLLTVLELYVR